MLRCSLGFAAIRLAVLEEPESEENIIFDDKPRPSKSQWFLDLENNPEAKPHDYGARRRCKATGNAYGDVAFSSPLVREPVCMCSDHQDMRTWEVHQLLIVNLLLTYKKIKCNSNLMCI